MKKRTLSTLFTFSLLAIFAGRIQAQVTIGSNNAPTLGALLELKSQQAEVTTDPNSNDNITSTKGGFLLPRVKLVGTATLAPFLTTAEATTEGQAALAGLMVYNLNGTPPLETGIYVWDGTLWLTAGFTKTAQSMTLAAQPKAFSFYETGEETLQALEFKVNPPIFIDGTKGEVLYQWYQLVGSNIHAKVGTPITTKHKDNHSYIPTAAIKTVNGSSSTRYAQNNGLYKFYCVAESGGVTLTSDVVEVAVGCGAKTNLGEWISFMCFNLGADNDMTIQKQKDYNIGTFTNDGSGVHTYISGEEKLWGNLYQWGRIADGHQDRQASVKAIGNGADLKSNINYGFYCSRNGLGNVQGDPYPYFQVKPGNDWSGKFIASTSLHNFNWFPEAASQNNSIDLLWRNGRFLANDPCAKYKPDGSQVPAWTTQDVPAGANSRNPDPACQDSGTLWRMPQQEEWGAIYKGGTISGRPEASTANTWVYYNGTASNYNRGLEIKPDGHTTTLFLPFSGLKSFSTGGLYHQGTIGDYWSSSISGNNAHGVGITASSVNPANNSARAYGFTLRCIKQ